MYKILSIALLSGLFFVTSCKNDDKATQGKPLDSKVAAEVAKNVRNADSVRNAQGNMPKPQAQQPTASKAVAQKGAPTPPPIQQSPQQRQAIMDSLKNRSILQVNMTTEKRGEKLATNFCNCNKITTAPEKAKCQKLADDAVSRMSEKLEGESLKLLKAAYAKGKENCK